jgi:hypothetical protein
MLPLSVAARVPLDVPVVIDREEAQRLARLELLNPEYRREEPGLIERAIQWLIDRVSDALDFAGSVSPLGWLGLAGVLVLLVLVAIAVRRRTGTLSRSSAPSLFEGAERSARDHRAEAERLAASGAYAEAVRERLRALFRDVEERDLVDARPGRTADEIARDTAAALPSAAREVREAARVFDDVWYGGRTADAGAYERVVRADDAVRRARPGDASDGSDTPLAVPR